MLHAFRILLGNVGWNAQGLEQTKNQAVPFPCRGSQGAALIGQENAAIRAIGNEGFSCKPLQSLGDGYMTDAQALGQIDGARLPGLLNEVLDQFHIIGRAFSRVVRTGLAKGWGPGVVIQCGFILTHVPGSAN